MDTGQRRAKIRMSLGVIVAVVILAPVVTLLLALKFQANETNQRRTEANAAAKSEALAYVRNVADEFRAGKLHVGPQANWGGSPMPLYRINVVRVDNAGAAAIFAADARYTRRDFLFGSSTEDDLLCFRATWSKAQRGVTTSLVAVPYKSCLGRVDAWGSAVRQ